MLLLSLHPGPVEYVLRALHQTLCAHCYKSSLVLKHCKSQRWLYFLMIIFTCNYGMGLIYTEYRALEPEERGC